MSTVAGLEVMDPVGLDELNAVAALQSRIDRKYLVPLHLVGDMLYDSASTCAVLDLGGRRSFEYRSWYFDTPDHLSFRLAAHGHRRRFKVRVRRYLDDGHSVLEVKTKSGRGHTVKHRMAYDSELGDDLTDDARRFVAEVAASRVLTDAHIERLERAIATRYRRSTVLVDPQGSPSRMTLDQQIEWSADGRRWSPITAHAVLETKTDGSPGVIDRWLWERGVRPVRISKFAVASLRSDPSLPANRWHAVLSRDAVVAA